MLSAKDEELDKFKGRSSPGQSSGKAEEIQVFTDKKQSPRASGVNNNTGDQ